MPKSRPVRHVRAKERRLPLDPPVRAWALAEWALLPLRIFLGATFLFAGLQKLANPNFLRASSPNSIHAQLVGAARVSPIHALLSHMVGLSTPIGIVIAAGEIAIGVGALLGLRTRIAAAGGMVLSFGLFLAVSFHSSPYYTGADIVFFFAWMPFVVAGSASRYSLDAWIANFTARQGGLPTKDLVAIPFWKVQTVCGHYNRGSCSARAGAECDAALCPFLHGEQPASATPAAVDAVHRRSVVLGGIAAATTAAGAAVLGSVAAAGGRLVGGAATTSSSTGQLSPGSTTTTTLGSPSSSATTVPSKYSGTELGAASQVPVGQSATFTVPTSGDPGIVIQEKAGEFVGYDTVCPHMGCIVGYSASANLLVCPCHGSQFLVSTGEVISGPAPRGLTKLDVVKEPDGNIYLK
jgi:thiosulfate dehydrogenase [quinone] large subunit